MRIGLACDLRESVVLDGDSPEDALEEYDSAETVAIIKSSLEEAGHRVLVLGGGREFLGNILREDVDIVFNIAEGRGSYRSREAQVPAILEMLDIPYSGSDPQCLAICLDKPLTKKLVTLAGVPTPGCRTIINEDELAKVDWRNFSFPVIIKPAYEGSSKGIRLTSLVDNETAVKDMVCQQLNGYGQPVMVEEFIYGDEITVGMVGNSPPAIIGIMRILPRQKSGHFVYSLEVKRDWQRLVDYECPARLGEKTLREITEYSRRIFAALGCRDFARLDFRVSADGIPYFIEINPLPGLGTYSDLVIMAKKRGGTHEGMIRSVFDAARQRYPQYICV